METMLTAFLTGAFDRNHTVRIRVIESIIFLSGDDEETLLQEHVVSLNIPFLFPFLLRQITLSLHIESELWGMGLGDSLTDFSNTISSYLLNLAHRGCTTMSINAYAHIVRDVRIDGYETVEIRPDFWVNDDQSGMDETEQRRVSGVDGVAAVDMDIGSSTTPPLRQRGASSSVINRLKKENRFNGENLESGEVDDCVICLEEQCGVKDLIKLPCSHLFHSHCICTWLETEDSCPICRRKSSDFS